jgi:hypothetical protein
MRFTHLLAVVALFCAVQTFAQTTSNQSVDAVQGDSPVVASDASDSFRISPYPQLDFASQSTTANDAMDRIHVDQYNPDQRAIELPPFSNADFYCLRIQSYRVARDSPESDSTHIVAHTDCVRAGNLRVYRTTDDRR